jgi:aerobic-type carbon monoxide dehydrogenase small subunit (CoxS/CutS family)
MSTPTAATPDDDLVPGRVVTLTVNGRARRVPVEDRDLLVDVVRHKLGLTGTHVGCYNGDCGACTLRVDGRITKSCLVLAAAADGAEITTIEGYSPPGELDDLQQALWEHDAFQCGFCIPGHLFALRDLLDSTPDPTEDEVRDAVKGNLCRCTGYVNLVRGACDAARRERSSHAGGGPGKGPGNG